LVGEEEMKIKEEKEEEMETGKEDMEQQWIKGREKEQAR
jgi:hypothetical protein